MSLYCLASSIKALINVNTPFDFVNLPICNILKDSNALFHLILK